MATVTGSGSGSAGCTRRIRMHWQGILRLVEGSLVALSYARPGSAASGARGAGATQVPLARQRPTAELAGTLWRCFVDGSARPLLGFLCVLLFSVSDGACGRSGAAGQRPTRNDQPSNGVTADVSAHGATTARAGVLGSIQGTVTDDAGRVVKRATLKLGVNRQEREVTTDFAGRYTIRDVAPGSYSLTAGRDAFVSMALGQANPFDLAAPIAVLEGQRIEGANFALRRAGAIIGRVTDEDGSPVTDARVTLSRYEYRFGRRQLVPVVLGHPASDTDDLGRFRLFNLAAGAYVLTVSYDLTSADAKGREIGYGLTYYPRTLDATEAALLNLSAGAELKVDVQLIPLPLVHLIGSLRTSDGAIASDGAVRLSRPGAAAPWARIARLDNTGTFHFDLPIPQGTYTLTAVASQRSAPADQGQTRTETGTMSVVLGGPRVDALRVTTRPGGKVLGSVVLDNGDPIPANLEGMHVFPVAKDPSNAWPIGVGARVGRDGRFELTNLQWPTLLIADPSPGSGWFVKGVFVDGREITDDGVNITTGEVLRNVTITLTSVRASLSGHLIGIPDGCGVVLIFAASENRRTDPRGRYVQTARPDSHGAYAVPNVAPGDYFAVALASLEAGSVTDSTLLAKLSRSALRVRLVPGKEVTLDLSVDRSD